MTGWGWAALIIGACGFGLGAIALVIARSSAARLAELEARLDERLREIELSVDKVGPLIADTRSALRKAESRVVRADDLVYAATAVATRADQASKVAYEVATSPVVRALAWGRGVRRGVAAIRGRSATTPTLQSGQRDQTPAITAGSSKVGPGSTNSAHTGSDALRSKRKRRRG
jgi:hypothetical protein